MSQETSNLLSPYNQLINLYIGLISDFNKYQHTFTQICFPQFALKNCFINNVMYHSPEAEDSEGMQIYDPGDC